MLTHCLDVLPNLRKCFLKEIFILRHMLSTHSSYFVALHLNFFFADTYGLNETINAMCGTRETLDMGILRQHSLSLAEVRVFASALPSPHRSTVLSVCPPTNIRFRFFDASASASKVFLSHCILARIVACTSKKTGSVRATRC